ncbi:MAG: hypothetical protein Q8K24_17295 [Hydrogenophaga sp.]|nr:hypothetical protein [Hydrogenophaga sp.]
MESFEVPYKKPRRIRALLLFFFRPKAFVDMSAEHDVAWLLSDSPDIRASYLKGEYEPRVSDHRANADARSTGLRQSLLHSELVVLVSSVVGLIAGATLRSSFGDLGARASNVWQAIAVGIILWVTLWQLTKDLQSFGGKSLPERVHGWIFNSLYIAGTAILFVVYGWQA